MRTSRTLQIASAAVIALALLCGWIFLAYQSFAYRSQIESISGDVRERAAKNSYLLSVRNALQEESESLRIIDDRFVARADIPRFIELLEEAARESGVTAIIASVDLEASSEAIAPLKLRITGSGAWQDIVNFVSTLDTAPMALRIDGLAITKNTRDKAAGVWNFSADLVQSVSQK